MNAVTMNSDAGATDFRSKTRRRVSTRRPAWTTSPATGCGCRSWCQLCLPWSCWTRGPPPRARCSHSHCATHAMASRHSMYPTSRTSRCKQSPGTPVLSPPGRSCGPRVHRSAVLDIDAVLGEIAWPLTCRATAICVLGYISDLLIGGRTSRNSENYSCGTDHRFESSANVCVQHRLVAPSPVEVIRGEDRRTHALWGRTGEVA